MRQKFRHRDIFDTGELSMEQMEDLLDELRDEAKTARARGLLEPETVAVKASQQTSPLGNLIAQAGIV